MRLFILLRVWKLLMFRTLWVLNKLKRIPIWKSLLMFWTSCGLLIPPWRKKKKMKNLFEKAVKVEVATKTAQNEPDVVAGERTPIGSTKDSFFNTETWKIYLILPSFTPLCRMSIALVPSWWTLNLFHFIPLFPPWVTTTEPSKVQGEVSYFHTPSPSPVVEPSTSSVESRLNSKEMQVIKIHYD